ncbi:hypothetical protein XM71_c11959 [Vibrio parahaemolyticus]|nr:hypothetical protein XM71_c11959 [Vibrio parahaemolyticus]
MDKGEARMPHLFSFSEQRITRREQRFYGLFLVLQGNALYRSHFNNIIDNDKPKMQPCAVDGLRYK